MTETMIKTMIKNRSKAARKNPEQKTPELLGNGRPCLFIAPHAVYRVLFKFFGPQGWWPVTPRGGALPVYEPNRSRQLAEKEKFEIALGAILTQNTSWKNVERTLANLNKAGLISPEKILKTRPSRLRKIIRPSGFFVQKEIKIRLFCRHLAAKHAKGISKWLEYPDLEGLRAELLGIYGIGPETADSILLYAGGRLKFVVDAYTMRLGQKIGWYKKITYAQAQSFFEKQLPLSVKCWQEFHALIVRFSKDFCRKIPVCAGCPLKRRRLKAED